MAPTAEAAAPDRIPAIDSTRLILLPATANPRAIPNNDLGRMDGEIPLPALSLAIKLTADRQVELDQLLADQQNPSSPRFRHWITPADFGARFGLNSHDLDLVTSWLKSEGFEIARVSNSRTRIFFTGTVAQTESAFHTEIHRYAWGGAEHFANSTAVSVPSGLEDVVLHIGGLNDFMPRPSSRGGPSPDDAQPGYSSLYGGSYHHLLAPQDLAIIYNVEAAYQKVPALDGTGVNIAVVGASSCTESNLASFRSLSGLKAANFHSYLVPNSGSTTFVSSEDNAETYLDVEWVGSLAPGAAINFVYTGGTTGFGAFDALEYAADSPADVGNPTIISVSYLECEQQAGMGYAETLRTAVQQASSEGITVIACTGDSGAAACDPHDESTHPAADGGIAVAIPATFPETTAAGGTELADDGGTFWKTTNTSVYGSATGYIPEIGWNDTSVDGGLASGTGGASTLFSKPSWQTGTPADSKRDVPDISLTASWDHDGYMLCLPDVGVSPVAQYCAPGDAWSDSSGYFWSEGGTSAVAPSFAGMVALIQQSLGSGGLGNINPTLYQLAATQKSAFHDVTKGNNIVPCLPGSPDCGCPSGTPGCFAGSPDQYGFTAGIGYDLVTGIGSVDFLNLWSFWPTLTTTSLAASRTTVAVGNTMTLTATIATKRLGLPLPADTVEFKSGSTSLGTGTVSATGAAPVGGTAKFTYTGTTVGPQQVVANFKGDATYLASSSPAVTINVVAALEITPSAPITVANGMVQFVASGGSGTYQWSLTSGSGGGLASSCAGSSNCSLFIGSTGDTKDIVTVTDAVGDTAKATVTVNGALLLTPLTTTISAGTTFTYRVSGGIPPYAWTVSPSTTGASVSDAGVFSTTDSAFGSYTVNVSDTVNDSLIATVTVLPPLFVMPTSPVSVLPAGKVTFSATGGQAPYTWKLMTNGSGGTMNSAGDYVAGSKPNTTDVMEVTDSVQDMASVTINVGAAASQSNPSGSSAGRKAGCLCSPAGEGAEPMLLLWPLLAAVRRRRTRVARAVTGV